MKPIPVESLHNAAGFTSFDSRRKAHAQREKLEQTFDAAQYLTKSATQVGSNQDANS